MAVVDHRLQHHGHGAVDQLTVHERVLLAARVLPGKRRQLLPHQVMRSGTEGVSSCLGEDAGGQNISLCMRKWMFKCGCRMTETRGTAAFFAAVLNFVQHWQTRLYRSPWPCHWLTGYVDILFIHRPELFVWTYSQGRDQR